MARSHRRDLRPARAGGIGGIDILDVTDPDNPMLIGHVNHRASSASSPLRMAGGACLPVAIAEQ
jgi:hypothetical protein